MILCILQAVFSKKFNTFEKIRFHIMKKLIYFGLYLLTSIILIQPQSFAQRPTSYGKEFRLTFLPNYLGSATLLTLDFSSRNLATVTVHTMYQDSTFFVLPGLVTTFQVPDYATDYSSFDVSDNTIHITSDQDLSVFATNSADRSTDATMVLPIPLLGTDYILQTYNESIGQFQAYGSCIATVDKTTVEITPASTMGPYSAGETFTVVLNAGESYVVASDNPQGTRIRSTDPCKPIAVFSATQCTNVQAPFCDHLFEQMWPVKYWGKTFLSVPLLARSGGDTYQITASEDNTKVKMNKTTNIASLNAYESTTLIIDKPSVIESNYPISVLQLSNGGSYDNNEFSDPFMVDLLPVEEAVDFITFSTTNGASLDSVNHYVNVTCKTADIQTVFLDTNLLYDNFKPYKAAPEYSYAQVSVKNLVPLAPLSTHALVSSGGMNAIVYGYAYHYSYGYAVGGSTLNTSFSFGYDEVACTQKDIHFYANLKNVPYINMFFWDFGDATTSTLSNPTHTYASPGTYSVQLIIADSNGCFIDSVTQDVTVNVREITKPTVTTSDDKTICKGESVQLSASGGTRYTWYPTEGLSNPNISNPVASPTQSTKYVVTVSSDSTCSFDTASIFISIKLPPIAKAKYEVSNYDVQFHSYTDDNVNAWTWDFGDNSPLNYDMEPLHTYPAKGTYKGKLVVKRACGDENSVEFSIVINGSSIYTDSVKNDPSDTTGGGGGGAGILNRSKETFVSLTPNPAQDYVQIHSAKEIKAMRLFDINGRLIQSWTGNPETISLRGIEAGLYFVQIKFNAQTTPVTLKLIREN